MKINNKNYYLGTKANFKKAKKPKRKPDYTSYSGRKKFISDFSIWNEIYDGDFWYSVKSDPNTAHNISEIYNIPDDEELDTIFDIDGDHWELLEIIYDGILIRKMEKISSEYWYTKKGVYRKSNHWGNVADNYWSFEGKEIDNENELTGFCKWEDFNKSSC